ncbi:MAG: hypothetical protein KDB35_20215 [Acidimicrobiales bacterium]|nr:hypothetical protein [Acidimicrobiales bacterium]MCB1013812.1 hypothetical protein [Acidimicrobiales bacterium]MCB9373442.1 glycosyl-4,4'-diaponeurosporenoate acyltransferase [Microthrixaceae bacterium]
MLVQWSVGVTVLVDSVAWFLVSLAAGYGCHRLGDRRLEHDTALTRLRRFERDGRVYERRLRITRWKDRLPEGGTLFAGGYDKRQVTRADLPRYLRETRRAEYTHWAIMAAAPAFALWNPWGLWLAMVVYAVVANLPCLVIQRYNRARVLRILERRR